MELFKLLGILALDGINQTKQDLEETTGLAESSETRMSGAFKRLAQAATTFLSFTALSNLGKQCLDAASDVEEMENKFNVVFGSTLENGQWVYSELTNEVNKWADEYARSIGRNSNNIKTYLADNQNMFVGMGMTREQSAGLSKDMIQLALDLASFNNLQEDQAINAMSKALMGESESAKTLGAVLNDNTRAMAMEVLGYQGKFDALTEAEKMEVRYQAILMQSTDAVGDCERSLDSYKGQSIQLQSSLQSLQEVIGGAIIPVATEFIGVVNDAVTWLMNLDEWVKNNETSITILSGVIGTITALIIAYNLAVNGVYIIMGVYNGIMVISTAVTTGFATVVAFLTSPIGLAVAAIGALITIGVLLYKNWDEIKNKAVSIFENIRKTITDKFENVKNKVKGIIDTMKGFFNFTFNVPKVKMPHFSVKPTGWSMGDLLKGKIPSLGISWYAKAMDEPYLFTEPTVIGDKGFGEAGDEMVYGKENFLNDIRTAVEDVNFKHHSTNSEPQPIIIQIEKMEVREDKDIERIAEELHYLQVKG